VSVRDTLERAMESVALEGAEAGEAERWLARAEVLLDWIAKHPRLVEINCEAAHLLSLYRGASVEPLAVDYRGVGPRVKRVAAAAES